MSTSRCLRPALYAMLGLSMLSAPVPARACKDPVFEYAIQHWPASDYRLLLFHRGALSSPHLAWASAVTQACERTDLPLNAVFMDSDQTAKDAAETWAELHLQDAQLPTLVVLFPEQKKSSERSPEQPTGLAVAWSAPLAENSARLLSASPLRTRIVRDLQAGKAAAFVLVRGGNAARDQEAQQKLDATLRGLEQQQPAAPDPADPAPSAPAEKPIHYSRQTVDLRDAAETVFLSMAFALSPGMRQRVAQGEPAIIGLYGRGRAFPPFAANSDSAMERVSQICQMVTASCSCQIKEMHPGVGLLFAADWDADSYPSADPNASVIARPDAPVAPPSMAALVQTPTGAQAHSVVTQTVATVSMGNHPALFRNLTRTVVVAVAGILVLSVFRLWRRRS